MAKISTKTLRIREGELDEPVELNIFYTSEYGFYAEVPDSVQEAFDQLDDKELKAWHGDRRYQRKYATRNEPHKRVVRANTEDDIIAHMRTLVVHLLTLTMKKEAVIIVTFNHNDFERDRKKDREPADPNKLGEVSLSLSLQYCHRITTTSGKEKFYEYHEQEWQGETETVRSEIHVGNWRSEDRVIPDTPENREFLEQLHQALRTLVAKMKKFTASSEDLLKVIQARQKLLTLPS